MGGEESGGPHMLHHLMHHAHALLVCRDNPPLICNELRHILDVIIRFKMLAVIAQRMWLWSPPWCWRISWPPRVWAALGEHPHIRT